MTSGDRRQIDAARQLCYHFFATALSDPRFGDWTHLASASYRDQMDSAAVFLREQAGNPDGEPAPGERPPEGFSLAEALAFLEMPVERIEREYRRIFGFLLSKDCPPYETEYCPQTFSIYRSQKLGDVAGFYRAFGLEPSRTLPERHDHIALELEFMAWLIGKERYAGNRDRTEYGEKVEICRRAQERFFEEHLGWWVPAFAMALRKKAGGAAAENSPRTFYGAVGAALPAFIAFERFYLGIAPPVELAAAQPSEEGAEMVCGGCAAGDAPLMEIQVGERGAAGG